MCSPPSLRTSLFSAQPREMTGFPNFFPTMQLSFNLPHSSPPTIKTPGHRQPPSCEVHQTRLLSDPSNTLGTPPPPHTTISQRLLQWDLRRLVSCSRAEGCLWSTCLLSGSQCQQQGIKPKCPHRGRMLTQRVTHFSQSYIPFHCRLPDTHTHTHTHTNK